jgi:hypothetical protein
MSVRIRTAVKEVAILLTYMTKAEADVCCMIEDSIEMAAGKVLASGIMQLHRNEVSHRTATMWVVLTACCTHVTLNRCLIWRPCCAICLRSHCVAIYTLLLLKELIMLCVFMFQAYSV